MVQNQATPATQLVTNYSNLNASAPRQPTPKLTISSGDLQLAKLNEVLLKI